MIVAIFLLILNSIFVHISCYSHIPHRTLLQNGGASSCPLDFNVLRAAARGVPPPLVDTPTKCSYVLEAIHIVQSEYFRVNDSFLPPVDSAQSCYEDLQKMVDEFIPNFDLKSNCGYNSTLVVQSCMNITNKNEFESFLPFNILNNLISACNVSLHGSVCASCSSRIENLTSTYFTGECCKAYASIYVASAGRRDRPIDRTTISCLFYLDFARFDERKSLSGSKRKGIIVFVFGGCFLVVLGVCLFGVLLKRGKMRRKLKLEQRSESNLAIAGFDPLCLSTTLVEFSYEEIKVATKNFSTANVIGKGGYGNVYKGVLPDGSLVAFKRFKKLSEDGEAEFMHELEVIASVRHVNLVALRGYCTVSTRLEGYQRILVCDLMKNGSLHDHLFSSSGEKLSWPVRQNIALGMAKGLAYLHYGVQPAIIHRDIKAHNILLDEFFEAKLADFGLARFSPDGVTHLSTSVAGTIGYVSPEYALYGQVTEMSDVYSFGIMLLELLSGKKAVKVVNNDKEPIILSDWAWSLAVQNRTSDVVDFTMPHLGPPQVLEKYVLVALLCSHPEVHVRPTMDQVVKLLDTNTPIPF